MYVYDKRHEELSNIHVLRTIYLLKIAYIVRFETRACRVLGLTLTHHNIYDIIMIYCNNYYVSSGTAPNPLVCVTGSGYDGVKS